MSLFFKPGKSPYGQPQQNQAVQANHQHEHDKPPGRKPRADDELQIFVGGLVRFKFLHVTENFRNSLFANYWNGKKPLNASEVDLQKHFEKFGLVDHISVAKDKNGGEGHKGFAFVTFVDKQVESSLFSCSYCF